MRGARDDDGQTSSVASDTLDQLVKLLVEAASPRKIIKLGSYTRGDQTPDSDLDVVVILEEVRDRCDEMVRLRRALGSTKMPIDVLVYSENDVRERGHWLGTALHDALQEGWILYGDD
ncbi:MAG: nucleotidyltransferase domain-containing protein [Chloroflexota bacterium]|nr:MAG: DNA polymerase subunit beta [Chloroflexota bacterium]